MNRTQVNSSQIQSIGHDPATKTLEVEFKNHKEPEKQGSVYHYEDVTAEQFEALRGAESVGSHFYKSIKGKFKYRKIA